VRLFAVSVSFSVNVDIDAEPHDKIRGVRKIDPIAISFQMREFL